MQVNFDSQQSFFTPKMRRKNPSLRRNEIQDETATRRACFQVICNAVCDPAISPGPRCESSIIWSLPVGPSC